MQCGQSLVVYSLDEPPRPPLKQSVAHRLSAVTEQGSHGHGEALDRFARGIGLVQPSGCGLSQPASSHTHSWRMATGEPG